MLNLQTYPRLHALVFITPTVNVGIKVSIYYFHALEEWHLAIASLLSFRLIVPFPFVTLHLIRFICIVSLPVNLVAGWTLYVLFTFAVRLLSYGRRRLYQNFLRPPISTSISPIMTEHRSDKCWPYLPTQPLLKASLTILPILILVGFKAMLNGWSQSYLRELLPTCIAPGDIQLSYSSNIHMNFCNFIAAGRVN